jgi:hypothetical protein
MNRADARPVCVEPMARSAAFGRNQKAIKNAEAAETQRSSVRMKSTRRAEIFWVSTVETGRWVEVHPEVGRRAVNCWRNALERPSACLVAILQSVSKGRFASRCEGP